MPLSGLKDKEIGKVKLLVTTRCQLACLHCFVPDTRQDMPWILAKRAADGLLQSQGRDKILCFFGGEPLIHWSLLEYAADYARRQARILGKRLTLAAVSNGILVNARVLDLLARTETRLAVSLAGPQDRHDRARYFKGGGGSYRHARRGLEAALSRLGPARAGVSLCVLPETASALMDSWSHLWGLGARCFNFEIIEGTWSRAQARAFVGEASRFAAELLRRVRGRDPLYFNPLNWELARGRLTRSRQACCPFWSDLCVYPDGDMLFSHFARNAPEPRRYVVGSLKRRSLRGYSACAYDSQEPACRDCLPGYLRGCAQDPEVGLVYRALESMTLKLAEIIRAKAARGDRDFSRYLAAVRNEESLF